jgi:tRNA threonylcarbamoyladenosine biosynthesis protein TsaB
MPDPRFLLLETSHQPGVVAIAEGAHMLAVRRLDEARRHARDLAPAVGELLASQGWKPQDIQAIVVGRGPGSYTGLRVGIISAKTFAYAAGCALLGLDTFAVLAAQAPAHATRLAVLADAQQDKVYVQEFENALPVSQLRIAAFSEWVGAVTTPIAVTGPALSRWASNLPPAVKPVPESLWYPQSESLLQLGLARYERGERDDVYGMEPIYLRPSAAEEKLKNRPDV